MAYGEGMKRLSPCPDELIGSLVEKLAPRRLLDLGCGRGDRLAYLSGRFPKMALAGADADPENAALAAVNAPGAFVIPAAAGGLPYPDGEFDCVLCECSFSLFDEAEAGAREIARVLRPGGALVLGELCTGEMEENVLAVPGAEAVKRLYSRGALEGMFARAGLTLRSYDDRSRDLAELAARMIFDGSLRSCVGARGARLLREKRAGYGLWVFEKKKSGLAAVIAAAGLSSRMGDFKPLLPFGGETVLSRCVRNMERAGADDIVIVTGRRAEDIRKSLAGRGLRFVHNEDYAVTQMLDSLRIGLREVEGRCSRVLITPVDVPAVRPETIRAILEAHGGFVRPVYGGAPGHPVALDAALIPDILAYGGEGGLRGAVEALKFDVTDVPTDDPGVCADADTPEDYKRLLGLENTL